MPNSPFRQKTIGEPNKSLISGKKNLTQPGVYTSPSRIPSKLDKPRRVYDGTAIRVSSNPFNINKSGRDYPLSESPNPTFKNKK
jgi:hypothetical protein